MRDDGATGSAENWGETTLTYNNAPANGSSIITDDSQAVYATLLGTEAVTDTEGTVNFSNADSTSDALLNFIRDDTNNSVTFIVTATTDTGAVRLYAKERTPDDLDDMSALSLTVVPEPASLVLLGLGGLCLIARRRSAS